MGYLSYFFIGVVVLSVSLLALSRFYFAPNDLPSWVRNTPIAHRGLFNHDQGVPENSLLAFQKAIDQGYGIELDVWLTKDGHPVVFHDETLDRMSSQPHRLQDLTLEQLQRYSLLGTKESIPSLKQVLALVKGQVPLLIEIKTETDQPASDIERILADLLDAYDGLYQVDAKGHFAVISFNRQSIAWFKQHRPHFVRGQTYDPKSFNDDTPVKQLRRIIQWALETKPYFLVYNHEVVNPAVQNVLRYLFHLVSYNVSSRDQLKKAKTFAGNVIFELIHPYD